LKRVYLDNGATTRTHPEVLKAMEPYFLEEYGNPSSVHSFGREALEAVENSREKVRELINARDSQEIIFTSGGTEADNLAIIGGAMANRKKGNHIITSAIEHHAVLHTCQYLEEEMGYSVTYLPVDRFGQVQIDDFKKALRKDTVLATIMAANNEIGTLQPIKELAALARENGTLFHTDAVQVVGHMPLDVQEWGVDMLSLSGHKFHGPKGVGALYLRKGLKIHPHMHGGAQEKKRRASTHNTTGIVGLGKACELARRNIPEKQKALVSLREKLIKGIEEKIDEVILNGHPKERLPGNVNFCFKYIEGESLLLSLDMQGIAASSGSACTSGSLDPSHVLLALGLSHEVAHGSLRLTLSEFNTEEDIDHVLEVLPGIVEKLREMSPLYKKD